MDQACRCRSERGGQTGGAGGVSSDACRRGVWADGGGDEAQARPAPGCGAVGSERGRTSGRGTHTDEALPAVGGYGCSGYVGRREKRCACLQIGGADAVQ
jgi:hypothetical protein